MTTTAQPTALAEARKALRCLYAAVSEPVASDVQAKCEAAFTALQTDSTALPSLPEEVQEIVASLRLVFRYLTGDRSVTPSIAEAANVSNAVELLTARSAPSDGPQEVETQLVWLWKHIGQISETARGGYRIFDHKQGMSRTYPTLASLIAVESSALPSTPAPGAP